jgi:hypothetical protein
VSDLHVCYLQSRYGNVLRAAPSRPNQATNRLCPKASLYGGR